MGRVIKNILATTPIPIFNTIDDGDIVVANCFYVYKHYIVKALTTGTFSVDEGERFYPGYIHNCCSEELPVFSNWVSKKENGTIIYEPNPEFVDPRLFDYTTPAAYQIVEQDCTNVDNRKYMSTYHSTTNYYDTDTHFHLGNYLRQFKSETGINLMPFYNCYAGQTLDNIVLHSQDTIRITDTTKTPPSTSVVTNYDTPSYSDETDLSKKCYAVPIKFGKQYTIAIDSLTPVILRPIMYKDGRMLQTSTSEKYSDFPELEGSTVTYERASFRHPFLFQLNTNNYKLKQRERYLLLVIQVESSVDSSLVVLEGNYIHSVSRTLVDSSDEGTIDRSTVYTDSRGVIQTSPQALSLLQLNARTSYAFSDRLIEYLLQNVIASTTTQENNIKFVQDILSKSSSSYKDSLTSNEHHYGTWDTDISRLCLEFLQPYSNKSMYWDQDGNVNKDLEKLMEQKWKEYDS